MFLLTGVLGHLETDYTDFGKLTTWESGPNSADLFGIQFVANYQGDKTIKYCIITCVPINAVGDLVACTVTDAVEARCRVTGPIAAGVHKWTFENGWYNPTIANVKITKVDIQYMDGSTETISGEKIEEDVRAAVEQHNQQQQQNGCYVATAVYGSYDCPEVWTLRRYRDQELAKTWLGRQFIHFYYATSPGLVKRYGNVTWLRELCRKWLNGVVRNLKRRGFKDTPYTDKRKDGAYE